jgi:hypothetical protein
MQPIEDVDAIFKKTKDWFIFAQPVQEGHGQIFRTKITGNLENALKEHQIMIARQGIWGVKHEIDGIRWAKTFSGFIEQFGEEPKIGENIRFKYLYDRWFKFKPGFFEIINSVSVFMVPEIISEVIGIEKFDNLQG